MPKLSEEHKEFLKRSTRDRAFKCACSILREEGWNGFTMDNLASRMGVSKGTLYNYFRDKAAVIVFLCNRAARLLAEDMASTMESNHDTRELLQYVIDSSLRGMKNFRFLNIAVWEMMEESGCNEDLERDAAGGPLALLISTLTRIIERGIREGTVLPGDPAVIATVLYSSLVGLEVAGRHMNIQDNSEEEDYRTRKQITEMLLRGICVPEEENK